MAKTMQIRNVPADVHAALSAKAAAAGLSLSDYLLREVTRLANRPTLREVLQRATDREWGVPPAVATAAVRDTRDAASGE
jgi:plasmid stability protein